MELFLDPAIRSPKLAIGWRLARRALGFRALMDVIPLDASLVKGSHGRVGADEKTGPLFISSEPRLLPDGPIAATAVKDADPRACLCRIGALHTARARPAFAIEQP